MSILGLDLQELFTGQVSNHSLYTPENSFSHFQCGTTALRPEMTFLADIELVSHFCCNS